MNFSKALYGATIGAAILGSVELLKHAFAAPQVSGDEIAADIQGTAQMIGAMANISIPSGLVTDCCRAVATAVNTYRQAKTAQGLANQSAGQAVQSTSDFVFRTGSSPK
jgi:hypothetical protein